MSHEKWMRRALELAASYRGRTSPNPMVGAVVVKNDRVVGEGAHQKAGLPHAEIEALNQAGVEAKGATLYLTLEPCCHTGRTPPCTDTVAKSGVKKVVVGMIDPNPAVNGKGLERLKEAGIEVEVGVLEKEARTLNEVFIKWIKTKLPFVILKAAMTLDGKIATSTGDSKWITSDESRKKVHEMRSWYDSILVGINTVLRDDPSLTARVPNGKNPIRLVFDSSLRTPERAKIVDTREAPTWIITAQENPEKEAKLKKAGVQVMRFPGKDGKVDVGAFCRYLGEKEITSVFVEGGARVHGSFLESELVDKVSFLVAPKIIGNHGAPGPIDGWGKSMMADALCLKNIEVTPVASDILIEGYL